MSLTVLQRRKGQFDVRVINHTKQQHSGNAKASHAVFGVAVSPEPCVLQSTQNQKRCLFPSLLKIMEVSFVSHKQILDYQDIIFTEAKK